MSYRFLTDVTGNKIALTANSAAITPLNITGAVSQTGDLQLWQNNDGSVLAYITSGCNLFAPNATFGTSTFLSSVNLGVTASSASSIPLAVKAATGQTANLQEWRNSSGTAISYVLSSGNFTIPTLNTTTLQNSANSNNSRLQLPSSGALVDTAVAANVALRVQNANATPTGDLTQWLNTGGTVLSAVTSAGNFVVRGTSAQGALTVYSPSTSSVGAVIRGIASQTADLQQWQNSSGTTLSSINSVGAYLGPYIRNAAANGAYLSLTSSYMRVRPATGTNPGVSFSGETGQTADLTRFTDISENILGGVNAAGQVFSGSTSAAVGTITVALTSAAYTSATVAVFTYGGTSVVQTSQTVTVAGVTGGAYNGTWAVSAVTTNTFTVIGSGFTNVAGTGGTVKISASGSFTATTSAVTPLIAKAASGQTAALIEWQDSTGALLGGVSSGGNLRTGALQAVDGNTVMVFAGGTRNFGILTASPNYGSGSGVMYVGNATTAPTGTASTGLILYANSGALSFTGTSLPNGGTTGTNVSIVNADGTQGNVPISINAVSTSYTTVLTDAGKNVELNYSATGTATIQVSSSVNYPIGTQITFIQTGTATTKIVGTTGVTVNHYSPTLGSTTAAATLKGQWAAATAVKRATDTWVLIGNLT